MLKFQDHRQDPEAWARSLGVSVEAVGLLHASGMIDLHNDLEVPVRVLGYDPARHHGVSRRVIPWMGQTDYPRIREAGYTGAVMDIATNPFRPAKNRLNSTIRLVARMVKRLDALPDDFVVARSASDYDEARATGRTAMWIALQGGNAVSADPTALDGPLGRDLHRITLVHLTTSDLGGTSSPAGRDAGVGQRGRDVIEAALRNKVLIDLAHTGKKSFWDALAAHDRSQPVIVSHTGVEAVRPHWRNVDDDQIRAIAERGGVVGVMYQSNFLAPVWWTCKRSAILDHLEHIIQVGGEGCAAIGTDYDGVIVPPNDLTDVTHHPKLVQDMLDRGWSHERIAAILAGNYLRVVREVRP